MEDIIVYIWLGVIIILAIIEALTLNLVTIWFAISAIFALIVAALGLNIYIQILVFIIIGILLLIFTKSFVHKLSKGKTIKTNYEAVINKTGIAIASINVDQTGYVKINGLDWLAYTLDEDIGAGDKVRVIDVQGVKVQVVKIKEQ